MNTILASSEQPDHKFANIHVGNTHETLGRMGSLETRLAISRVEIEAAQALRYNVFVEEMGATLPMDAMLAKRDFDQFDAKCEHLLVIDTERAGTISEQIVGTYRLMCQTKAEMTNGFYSQGEYDVAGLTQRHGDKKFLELGRSCVLPEYRTRRSIELLWQGLWSYIRKNNIDVMFGCASFPGIVPAAHAQAMAFLYHFAKAESDWSVLAQSGHCYSMDLMPKEAISPKEALLNMPPLIKGYLRLGALVSPQAVVDADFNTTDVLVVLPVTRINTKYINYYGADADRFAA